MDIFFDALIDSLKILPFIFVIYLLIEYAEHKNNADLSHILMKTRKLGPVYGSFFGCIPQCGFSVIAADLFSKSAMTLGTLMAVFIATSDEAIPIILSNPKNFSLVFKVIGMKFLIGLIAGFIVDIIYKKNKSGGCSIKEKHTHFHGNCESCDHGIFKSALIHSVKIFLFIFVVSYLLGFIVDKIGEEAFSNLLMKDSFYQPVIASLIGLIPNCASSVLLTQTYLNGALSFGSLIAGLCSGAGVGLVVLFKNNKNLKENIAITNLLFLTGVVSGIIIQLF